MKLKQNFTLGKISCVHYHDPNTVYSYVSDSMTFKLNSVYHEPNIEKPFLNCTHLLGLYLMFL